jgi:nitrate reductase NapE component
LLHVWEKNICNKKGKIKLNEKRLLYYEMKEASKQVYKKKMNNKIKNYFIFYFLSFCLFPLALAITVLYKYFFVFAFYLQGLRRISFKVLFEN